MRQLEEFLIEKLSVLRKTGPYRELVISKNQEGLYITRKGKKLLSFASNDYLGLSRHPEVKNSYINAAEKYGAGAGASRLITGNHELYQELEEKLARFKGAEGAIVFGSGYLANTGVIPAIMDKNDLIIADKLVHACILDGIKLSQAKFSRFSHNNIESLEKILRAKRNTYDKCMVVTETVFSMDGDLAPLNDIRKLCDQYHCIMMTDDAHGLAIKSPADIQMGTLSKAFGSYGGYVCGSKNLIDYLVNSARSFIFSTALPPAIIAASITAIEIMMKNSSLLAMPFQKATLFTGACGIKSANSQIVPVILKNEEKAVAFSRLLEGEGFFIPAIRPPTVPVGTSRLRLSFSAMHEDMDIMRLAEIFKINYPNISY